MCYLTSALKSIHQNGPLISHQSPSEFCEIDESIGVSNIKEENLYMRLSPNSPIGRAKDWYLDQLATTMMNWKTLEYKFIKRFTQMGIRNNKYYIYKNKRQKK